MRIFRNSDEHNQIHQQVGANVDDMRTYDVIFNFDKWSTLW
jgi:hypothetical protein